MSATATHEQLTLPIEGWASEEPIFFVDKILENVASRIQHYISFEASVSGRKKLFWPMAEQQAAERGHLLIPYSIYNDLRYKITAKGYGATIDELPAHNALWNDVLENFPATRFIEKIDGPVGTLGFSSEAHEVSLNAMRQVLLRDYENGKSYRDMKWPMHHDDDA